MNYESHYNKLIERAKNRLLEGYSESHHIIPRCLGGSDDRENLVDLTPEEHYVAHQLLVKMYPNEHKLVYAANMMGGTRDNNKIYGWLRRKYVAVLQENTGWTHSEETKAKIAEALRGQPKSKEARKKMSIAKKGKPSHRKGATQEPTSGCFQKGNTPWNVGKPAWEKAVEVNGVVYPSRKIAAEELNKDITTIIRWVKNGKALDRSMA